MANLFFLVLAIVLLLVAVFSLVSYIKDRKKQQFTFKKGVNNKPPLERHASVNFLK
jgi:predicted membrane protein